MVGRTCRLEAFRILEERNRWVHMELYTEAAAAGGRASERRREMFIQKVRMPTALRQFKNLCVVVAVPTREQNESFNQSYHKRVGLVKPIAGSDEAAILRLLHERLCNVHFEPNYGVSHNNGNKTVVISYCKDKPLLFSIRDQTKRYVGCCQWWNDAAKRVATLEFDRNRKSMGVIVKKADSGKNLLLVKPLDLILRNTTVLV
ncbi:hypothetical protein ABZP36_002690 [Zizania latifolia]